MTRPNHIQERLDHDIIVAAANVISFHVGRMSSSRARAELERLRGRTDALGEAVKEALKIRISAIEGRKIGPLFESEGAVK